MFELGTIKLSIINKIIAKQFDPVINIESYIFLKSFLGHGRATDN